MTVFFPIKFFYPSQIGGPSNAVYWLVKELKGTNISTQVFTSNIGINNLDIKFNKWTECDFGRVYYSNPKNYFANYLVIFRSIRLADVLHLNSLFSEFSIVTFLFWLLFFRKKPLIWSTRGELSASALKYSKKKKSLFLYFLGYFRFEICFHSTCLAETRDIQTVFKESRIIEIPNFISPADRVVPISVLPKALLFLGRIHPIKRIENVIRAISNCTSFISNDFIFQIAGSFEERHRGYFDYLRKIVSDLKLDKNVKFIGQIEGYEKEHLLANSLFLILPSDSENFGNVVLEALNQGTPVIASTGTPWSLLEVEGVGFYIDNDVDSLSKVIDNVVKICESDYINISLKCQEFIDQQFSISKNIFQWINVYNLVYNENQE